MPLSRQLAAGKALLRIDVRGETMVAVDERARLALHQRLEAVLGDEAAMTLMQHLPPRGWTDIATKGDIGRLEHRFDGLEQRFDGLEHRFDGLEHRFDGLERRMDRFSTRLEDRLENWMAQLESRLGDQTSQLESRLEDQTSRFESRMDRSDDQMERLHGRMDGFHQELRAQTRVYILAMLGAMATNTSIIVAATHLR